MARTRASVGAKLSMGKSSKARCSVAPTTSNSSGDKSSRSYSGGNPVRPRETPTWQKPITTFIYSIPKIIIEDSDAVGSSKIKPQRKIIYSDEETDTDSKSLGDETIDVDNNKVNEMDTSEVVESRVYGDSTVDKNKVIISEVESQIYGESEDYNLIESPPKNKELEDSIILEPLSGENSHKMEEYFPKTTKQSKGVGKKSNKENLNNYKIKRRLDKEYDESPNKKIKIE